MEEWLRRVTLPLQKRRTRSIVIALLTVVLLSQAILLTHNSMVASEILHPDTKYPARDEGRKLSDSVASELPQLGEETQTKLLTVTTRTPNIRTVTHKKNTKIQGAIKKSLTEHARNKAKIETSGNEDIDLTTGKAVEGVNELGTDKVRRKISRRRGEQKSSVDGNPIEDMLKTGLDTFNGIQSLSKMMRGSEGRQEGSPVMDLLGTLLKPSAKQGGGVLDLVGSLIQKSSGHKGQGEKSGGKKQWRLGPLVDSAFDMLGGEETTGGIKRFAKPFIRNLLTR